MYDAVPAAAAAWRALFEKLFLDLAFDAEIIEHGWPHPIDELWNRPDLGCAFMCGFPFSQSRAGQQALAAPVPSPPRYQGLPRYCSEFLVRGSSGWTRLEDSFGARFGWMAANSQSGYRAPMAHLAKLATPQRPNLYAETKGPLGTPARTLEALRAGDVDVVALDSFWLDLVRHHEPARLEAIRCVATTPWTPIPLLVAARDTPAETVDPLRAHLMSLHTIPSYAPLLTAVLVERFAAPDLAAYAACYGLKPGTQSEFAG